MQPDCTFCGCPQRHRTPPLVIVNGWASLEWEPDDREALISRELLDALIEQWNRLALIDAEARR